MEQRKILFSPPDISQKEIDEVVDTLKSGWITTGPKTKLFEQEISNYCNSVKTVCLNSATACMELVLRLFDIGPGDDGPADTKPTTRQPGCHQSSSATKRPSDH